MQHRPGSSCRVVGCTDEKYLPTSWTYRVRSHKHLSYGYRPATRRTRCTVWGLVALVLLLNPGLASAAPAFTASSSGGANPLSAINDPYAGIIVGDFDTDGDVDVLAYDDDTHTSYTFYRNGGDGTFSAVSGSGNPFDGIPASAIFYESLTTYVSDFDNDGDLDIWDYQGETSGDGVNIYLENTTGSRYTSSLAGGTNPLSAIPDTPYSVIIGDFDTDGDVDVLAYDDDTYTSLTFYQNDGAGHFSAVSGAANPFDGIAAADMFYDGPTTYVADFDNDGDLDIWDYQGEIPNDGVSIYLENTTGSSYTSSLSGGANPLSAVRDLMLSVIVGDFDSDGDVDVVGYDSGHVFYRNDGNGGYSAVSGSADPFDTLTSGGTFLYYNAMFVSIADFDSDGDMDIWDHMEVTDGDGITLYLEQSGAPPAITGSTPADNAIGFAPSADLVLDFSENVTAGSGNIILRDYATDAASATFDVSGGEVSVSGSRVTLNPNTDLSDSTHYYVEIQPGALVDSDGATLLNLTPALNNSRYYGAFKDSLDFTTNSLPLLGGSFTTAGSVDDNATTRPFGGVTVNDSDGNDVSIGIVYDALNGSLSGTGLNGSAGSYTLSATDTATQSARLQALVFTPTPNQVAPTGTTLTTFTLTPNDGIGDGTSDASTRIIATSINDAPAFTGTPAIAGTARVGNTLSATDTATSDVDTGDGITLSYQWKADGVPISGATAASFTLGSGEAHTTITLDLSGSDNYGASTGVHTTAGVGVANATPVNTALPTISGSAASGNTLTASTGGWIDDDGDSLSFAYQWLADGAPISGATNSGFTVGAVQEGLSLSVRVTASDGYGASVSATSAGLAVNRTPSIGGTPATSVSGYMSYGFTPTASDGDNDPLVFSIVNKPAWAAFDTTNGRLSGTPTNSDVGTTTGIVISVSDGVSAASIGFDLSVTENTDIDGDGMPNDWETANGLDPYDPNDAASDFDGDGISNLDEYLAASDPTVDDNPPLVTQPADITVDAIGLFTPVEIGQASAYDDKDGALSASADFPSHFRPGLHNIVWSARDTAGNSASAVQQVLVNPQVSFAMDQATGEGSAVTVRVILNGEAARYPVSVPYVVAGSAAVDGSDHDLSDGTAVIASGLESRITFHTVDDGPGEGREQIVIAMENPVNAVAGPHAIHTIDLLEGNLAPQVSLSAEQGGAPVRTATVGDGPVRVSVNLTDPDSTDSHSYDWSGTDPRLSDLDGAADTYTFSPAGLAPGLYTIRLSVSDGTATDSAELALDLISAAPSLSATLDSDGDGTNDASEGIIDSDNDGVDDYLDAIDNGNVLQEEATLIASHLMESEAGVRLTLGPIALLTRSGGAGIGIDEIVSNSGVDADTGYDFVGGLFDFAIEEIPMAGQSVRVVLPQLAPIPQNPVYRKAGSAAWRSFVVDAGNRIASAAGESGYCPPPGDSAYTSGLTPGDWCVELTIEDGGPNDADGSANHAIGDPGGVARDNFTQVSVISSGGGGGSGMPLLLALFALTLLRAHLIVQRRAA